MDLIADIAILRVGLGVQERDGTFYLIQPDCKKGDKRGEEKLKITYIRKEKMEFT